MASLAHPRPCDRPRPSEAPRQDEQVEDRPPEGLREPDHARVSEELAEVAPHGLRGRGVRRAQVHHEQAARRLLGLEVRADARVDGLGQLAEVGAGAWRAGPRRSRRRGRPRIPTRGSRWRPATGGLRRARSSGRSAARSGGRTPARDAGPRAPRCAPVAGGRARSGRTCPWPRPTARRPPASPRPSRPRRRARGASGHRGWRASRPRRSRRRRRGVRGCGGSWSRGCSLGPLEGMRRRGAGDIRGRTGGERRCEPPGSKAEHAAREGAGRPDRGCRRGASLPGS